MKTTEVIGYRVINFVTRRFVNFDGSYHWLSGECAVPPAPIPKITDAYRRMAAFLDAYPEESFQNYRLDTVYRETTPIEDTANELGGLFEDLCKRHGLDLGVDRKQINAILQKDLEQVKNLAAFCIPGRR